MQHRGKEGCAVGLELEEKDEEELGSWISKLVPLAI